MDRRTFLVGSAGLVALLAGCSDESVDLASRAGSGSGSASDVGTVRHSKAEWRKLLSDEQFAVLREEDTERPFTSTLLDEHRTGTFACAGCDLGLFSSTTKFDSHTGWPSFWKPLPGAVGAQRDTSFGMVRTSVHCNRCEGHLGHVFDDGPKPTGLRYCINGVALQFHPSRRV